MKFIFEYKNDAYTFEHQPTVTFLNETQFIDRCWFIIKNKNNANVEAYADLWLAWKYHESTYAPDIMNTLCSLDRIMWDC